MIVRRVYGKEKQALRPWHQPYGAPHLRNLDAEEQRELAHLVRTRQATVEQVADRFGVSVRTVYRYLNTYPSIAEVGPATARVLGEAIRIGLPVSPSEAQRLAIAALSGERAA